MEPIIGRVLLDLPVSDHCAPAPPFLAELVASGKDRPIIYGQSGSGGVCVLHCGHLVDTAW